MRKQQITTRIGRPLVGVGLAVSLCGLHNSLAFAQEGAEAEPTAASESKADNKGVAFDLESTMKQLDSFTLPIGASATSYKKPTTKPSEDVEDLSEEPEVLEETPLEEPEQTPETLEKKLIQEGKKLEASGKDNSKLTDQEVRSLWEKLAQKPKAPQTVLRKGDLNITIPGTPGEKAAGQQESQNVASLVVAKDKKDEFAGESATPKSYASGEALITVGDKARVPGALLGFKDKKEPAPLWYLPQEKDANPEVPSVGFNFEKVPATKKVTVALSEYHGPGRMVTAEMGEEKAEAAFDSQDLDQAWEYEGGSSYRQAFAFTAPGAYTAKFTFSVEDQNEQNHAAAQKYSFSTTFLVGAAQVEKEASLKEIAEKSVDKKPLKEAAKKDEAKATNSAEPESKESKKEKPKTQKDTPKEPQSQESETSAPKTPEAEAPKKDPEKAEPETKESESEQPKTEEPKEPKEDTAPSAPSPLVPVGLKNLAKEIRELDRELNTMSRQTDSLFKVVTANDSGRKQEQRKPASNDSARTERGRSEQGSPEQNTSTPDRSSRGTSSDRGGSAAKPNKPRSTSSSSGGSSAKPSTKDKEASKDKKKPAKKSTEKKASAKPAEKTADNKADEAQEASNEKIAATGESMRKRGWWTGFLFGLGAMAMLGGVVFFTQARNIAKRK
ncbi:hypothetical protein [Corynebacterium silvaticum]|uniref:Uncharacterized protein n=1 Tax=Corynebacterium silvaticum TaxID=2320431 RepID=A0A7Y4LI87_9CORY|nr:hypothetical protein [Corynebacterium silvaticum]ARU45481.1 hypothetical protein CBE74_02065 [Corynebacterium silvaticum]NON70571.1 hypothetical protein [Corynebacterium silvaticum]UWH00593.1 hypothetical protein K1I39_02045 [Corynebacterium silvaticum]UWH02642.1 hypothetical protein K1I38_02055 [Corynebacterium silvaticum]UWH04679.1 hypothetical protein K1I36_02060 [Corynebacterium silvaticum]